MKGKLYQCQCQQECQIQETGKTSLQNRLIFEKLSEPKQMET